MDDFDIYDDLQLLQEEGKQKAEEDLLWKEKYLVALGTIEKLQVENKGLNKKIKLLETNFGGLLDTARAEIKRKDSQIAELRTEIDDICFRRIIRPGGKHSSNDAATRRSRYEHHRPAYDSNKSTDIETKLTFVQVGCTNYKQPYSRNVEEKKRDGPGHSGQSHDPFQGESSGKLGSSRSKNDKESHMNKQQIMSHNDQNSMAILNQHNLSKQEKLEEHKNTRPGNLENNKNKSDIEKHESVQDEKQDHAFNEIGRNVKDEKVAEEDILKDLKEFKKKKQIDVKKDAETRESTLVASNEKSNVLFDALFDDLVMNEEDSKDIYCGLETRTTKNVCDIETNEKKTRNSENSTVEHKLFTPKKPSTTKLLADLFGASPDDSLKQGIEKKHSPLNHGIELKSTVDKISATKFERKDKSYKTNKQLCSFKFAELDSSFYSSDEEMMNEEGKDKCSLSKSNDMASNLIENCEDSNGIMATNDPLKNKFEEKNTEKNLDTKIVSHNEDVHFHKKVNVNTECNYKSLQTDKQEKTISARHISERKEIKDRDGIQDHTHPSWHNKSTSSSKSHKHEKESREKVHFSSSSKVGTRNESIENKGDCRNQLKYEHDRWSKVKKHHLNKNVSLNQEQVVIKVPSKEIKLLSCDYITLVQPSNGKEKGLSYNKKQQENIATLEFEKKTNIFKESNDGKERLTENVPDKLPRREIINEAIELLKASQTDHKKIDEFGKISKPIEADPTTNKNYEQDKADALSKEFAISNNSSLADFTYPHQEEIVNNANKLPKEEYKKVAMNEPQIGTVKVNLREDEDNINKCGQTKASNADLVLELKENNISTHNRCILRNNVDLRQDISSDVCGSNNSVNLNHELVTLPINQIKYNCSSSHEKFHELKEEVVLEVACDPPVFMTKDHNNENLKEVDLKSNQSNKNDADLTIKNSYVNASPEEVSGRYTKLRNIHNCKESEINMENAFDDSSKQQLVTDFNNLKNECDAIKPANETIVESDIDDNEHVEMPRLLVEEEPEEISTCEKLNEIKMNPDSLETFTLNVIRNENRLHHKKRILQNSRTTESVSTNIKCLVLENDLSSQLDVDKVLRMNSYHHQTRLKSISPDGITCNEHENNKISLNFTISDEKQTSHFEPPFSDAKESAEKSSSKARYKKKILQKYKDSNKCEITVKKALQHNSSSSCETIATSAHCNNTNQNNTDLEKLTDENKAITEIAYDKESHQTSKDLDSSTNKNNKSNSLQKCEKSKQVKNTTVVVQCEKRKLSLTTESENVYHSKILKFNLQDTIQKQKTIQKQDKELSKVRTTKEQICKNLKTNSLYDSNVSFVPNIDTTELSTTATRKVSNHSHYLQERCLTVPTKTIYKEQSNEVSSQSLLKYKETLNNETSFSELTKPNIDDNSSLYEDQVTTEEENVSYLKRKTKSITSSKEKKRKRKTVSPNLSGEIEGKVSKSKKSKKMDAQTPNDLKLSSLRVHNKNKQTKCKNEKSSPSSSNSSDLIHHNIFSNDDCVDDRNLPVICNDNDDPQYQEIDKRMRFMFQSPTYKPSTMENPFDNKSNSSPQWNNDTILNYTVNETINKSEKSQCDTSSLSRKISVGSNDYVIETVGAHVANVFVTRKKCKKRTKIVVATV